MVNPQSESEITVFQVQQEFRPGRGAKRFLDIFQTLDDANNAARQHGNQVRAEWERQGTFMMWKHDVKNGREVCQINEEEGPGNWTRIFVQRLGMKKAGSEQQNICTWNDKKGDLKTGFQGR